MSLCAHKIYGPKGVGAMYIREGIQMERIDPLLTTPILRKIALIHGGGQEQNRRSGTLAPSLCVGLGEAISIAHKEMEAD